MRRIAIFAGLLSVLAPGAGARAQSPVDWMVVFMKAGPNGAVVNLCREALAPASPSTPFVVGDGWRDETGWWLDAREYDYGDGTFTTSPNAGSVSVRWADPRARHEAGRETQNCTDLDSSAGNALRPNETITTVMYAPGGTVLPPKINVLSGNLRVHSVSGRGSRAFFTRDAQDATGTTGLVNAGSLAGAFTSDRAIVGTWGPMCSWRVCTGDAVRIMESPAGTTTIDMPGRRQMQFSGPAGRWSYQWLGEDTAGPDAVTWTQAPAGGYMIPGGAGTPVDYGDDLLFVIVPLGRLV